MGTYTRLASGGTAPPTPGDRGSCEITSTSQTCEGKRLENLGSQSCGPTKAASFRHHSLQGFSWKCLPRRTS